MMSDNARNSESNMELPFHNLTNYNIENEYWSPKRRITNLLDNKKFLDILKDNYFDDLFNPEEISSCRYYDENDFAAENRTGFEYLNVISLNIRSLPKYAGELVCFLNTLNSKFDVIILTEIGAKNISVVENILPGYTLFHVTPCKNKCGGVGIYLSDTIKDIVTLDETSITMTCRCDKCEVESLFIECSFHETKYTIGGIYRHPNGNIDHFISELEKVIITLDPNRRTILAGDMNIDLIRFSENDKTLQYVTTLLSHRFLPYITLPTRITSHSATCIDHIFIKSPVGDAFSNMISGIFYCDISDHLPCFTSIWHNLHHNPHIRPYRRIFGHKNCTAFMSKMESENWQLIYRDENEDWYSRFINTVLRIYESSFPLVKVSRSRFKDKPWLTCGLKISIKTKNKMYRISLKRPQTVNMEKYKRYKLLLRKCLKQAEIEYYNNLFENNKQSTFNLWKHLGHVINPKKKNKFTSISKLLSNDRIITNGQSMADEMNNFFCNIGPQLEAKIPNRGDEYKKYLPQRMIQSFYITSINEREIISEIKKTNHKKAPGHDTIGAKLIKLCPQIFAQNLCKIYNKSINDKVYPDELKIAKVIALYKKGVKCQPGNYRPISLLSIFDKIFEKLICQRLMSFIDKFNILFENQFGFRKKYSTTHALIEFTDYIKKITG